MFKRAPHLPFDTTMTEELGKNALVIRVQPDEGITTRFGSKVPGNADGGPRRQHGLLLRLGVRRGLPEAYERLILDVLLGEPSLFPVNREVEFSWEILDPVLDYWAAHGKPDPYESGTLGAGVGRRDDPPAWAGNGGGRDCQSAGRTTTNDINKKIIGLREEGGAITHEPGAARWSSRPTPTTCSRIPSRRPTSPAASIPCRVIVVVAGRSRCRRAAAGRRRSASARDAGAGEIVVLRLHGELADHASSVVLPFLLPDTPVVAWWPAGAPRCPAQDPLGQLAIRRITDATNSADPLAAIKGRLQGYIGGRHRSGVEPDHLLARAAGVGARSGATRADHLGAGVGPADRARRSTSWPAGWPAGSTARCSGQWAS